MIMIWFEVTRNIISYKKHLRNGLLYSAKVITVEMNNCCEEGLAIFVTRLVLEMVVWVVFKELLDFSMTGLNKLIICVSQSLMFKLKIIRQMINNYMNF